MPLACGFAYSSYSGPMCCAPCVSELRVTSTTAPWAGSPLYLTMVSYHRLPWESRIAGFRPGPGVCVCLPLERLETRELMWNVFRMLMMKLKLYHRKRCRALKPQRYCKTTQMFALFYKRTNSSTAWWYQTRQERESERNTIEPFHKAVTEYLKSVMFMKHDSWYRC